MCLSVRAACERLSLMRFREGMSARERNVEIGLDWIE